MSLVFLAGIEKNHFKMTVILHFRPVVYCPEPFRMSGQEGGLQTIMTPVSLSCPVTKELAKISLLKYTINK
jgi:hypothetical protein